MINHSIRNIQVIVYIFVDWVIACYDIILLRRNLGHWVEMHYSDECQLIGMYTGQQSNYASVR